MDLLARRYANPYFLLDAMIRQGRFFEYVMEVNQMENENKLWEIWLFRVFDKSFDDWTSSLQETTVDESEIEATVKDSINILNGFNPNSGGKPNGTI